jgi:hypothetical protein
VWRVGAITRWPPTLLPVRFGEGWAETCTRKDVTRRPSTLCHRTVARNGVDILTLSKLMGHSDLQVLRRYLAQTDEDVHTAHMRGSPVDNNL